VANLTTADSGGQSPKDGSSAQPSRPTGRRTASARFERARVKNSIRLIAFDRSFGADFVCGADEAGRGCLAGPIVAAAVRFDHTRLSLDDVRALADLDDSKKRKGERRELLYDAVLRTASSIAVVMRPASSIDSVGLHKTNLEILGTALATVGTDGSVALADGFQVELPWGKAEKVIGGDGRSASIAAASIIAKVVRDRWMCDAAERYPEYGFDRHFGYATEEHREAIMRFGPTDIHRRSFKSSSYDAAA
jgi:ribonuclease HII